MRFGSDDFLFYFETRGLQVTPFTFRDFSGNGNVFTTTLSSLGRHVSGFEENDPPGDHAFGWQISHKSCIPSGRFVVSLEFLLQC